MPCSLRRATPEDLAALVPLFDGYRVFYGQDADPDRAEAFLAARFEAADTIIFLAHDDDGHGLGFTQLFPSWSSVRTGRLWILNDLFVAPEGRRQGVARRLMEAALAFAREDGALGVTLATQKDNHGAAALYRQLGFVLDEEFDAYEHTFTEA
ncbi:MAG: GNAT family N-acetyltransferase [Planctomycetota bacterium]|jgi:GNAT superfamily N-acetyltransferase